MSTNYINPLKKYYAIMIAKQPHILNRSYSGFPYIWGTIIYNAGSMVLKFRSLRIWFTMGALGFLFRDTSNYIGTVK